MSSLRYRCCALCRRVSLYVAVVRCELCHGNTKYNDEDGDDDDDYDSD